MAKRATKLVIAVAAGVIQLLAIVSAAAAEDPPTQLWNVTFSNGDVSEIFGVATGPDGNPVVTGISVPSNRVDHNIRTIKYDAATGSVLWNVTFDSGPGGEDQAYGVAIGPDGNPVVAGFSGNDVLVIKYDGTTGAVLWNVAPGAGGGNSVAIRSDGNPFVIATTCNATECMNRTVKLD